MATSTTATTTTTKTGYCNGSDMLLYVGDKAAGHCTTHTTTMTSETKERQVKPVATAPITKALFKGKGVIGLSYTISSEGLVFYGETESGFKAFFKAWKAGESITVKCMERGDSARPYLVGKCVITSLERTDPANADSTYSVTLENDGAPDTLDESAITETTPSA